MRLSLRRSGGFARHVLPLLIGSALAGSGLAWAAEPPAGAEGKTAASAPAAGASRPAVSMSELRSLIDLKIAEVRARQAAAPTVNVVAKAPSSRQRQPGGQACAQGKRQSPIDIRDGIKVQLEPIQFDYHPTPFHVIDNGQTVQANVPPGNNIMVSGRRYALEQLHFHRPSEHRINGHQYEMEMHLVHKDAQGHQAVVAVLMDQGKEHPMVQLVWNSLPLEKGTEQPSPVPMDLNLMLPEQRQYYTFMGSLTTPPCTEGVLWLVMKQAATLSPYQSAVFSRLYAHNARPVQDLGGRLIKEGQ